MLQRKPSSEQCRASLSTEKAAAKYDEPASFKKQVVTDFKFAGVSRRSLTSPRCWYVATQQVIVLIKGHPSGGAQSRVVPVQNDCLIS